MDWQLQPSATSLPQPPHLQGLGTSVCVGGEPRGQGQHQPEFSGHPAPGAAMRQSHTPSGATRAKGPGLMTGVGNRVDRVPWEARHKPTWLLDPRTYLAPVLLGLSVADSAWATPPARGAPAGAPRSARPGPCARPPIPARCGHQPGPAPDAKANGRPGAPAPSRALRLPGAVQKLHSATRGPSAAPPPPVQQGPFVSDAPTGPLSCRSAPGPLPRFGDGGSGEGSPSSGGKSGWTRC
jgi:hypothetical protein